MILWKKQDYNSLFLDEYFKLEKDFNLKNQELIFSEILKELNSNNIFQKQNIKNLLHKININTDINELLNKYYLFIPSTQYFQEILSYFIKNYGLIINEKENKLLLEALILSWNIKKTKYPSEDDFFNALFLKTKENKGLYKKIYFLKKSIAA